MKRKWFDWRAARSRLSNPAVGPVVLTFFLATLGFGRFEVTLSLLTKDALGISDKHNSLLFAYVGLVLALPRACCTAGWRTRQRSRPSWRSGMLLMGWGCCSVAGVSGCLANAHWLFRRDDRL